MLNYDPDRPNHSGTLLFDIEKILDKLTSSCPFTSKKIFNFNRKEDLSWKIKDAYFTYNFVGNQKKTYYDLLHNGYDLNKRKLKRIPQVTTQKDGCTIHRIEYAGKHKEDSKRYQESVHIKIELNEHVYSEEELKKMYQILKPKIVFPVHGDKRFIREHKRFALACKVGEVCSGKNGDVFLLSNGKIEKTEEILSDVIGVDRGRSVSLNSELVKTRKRIAYNCSLFISAVISKDLELKDLQISSVDILEEDVWQKLSEDIKQTVIPLINDKLKECRCINSQMTDFIKGHIRKRVLKATDIKPVTLLHIYQEQ